MGAGTKTCRIGVIGLGYVGLPLAMLFVQKNHSVTGIELDTKKIQKLHEMKSYLSDVTDEQVIQLMSSGRFKATDKYDHIIDLDVIVICVPTPLTERNTPELKFIQQAGLEIQRVGVKGKLVVLESSTYPGTTEEVLLPILQKTGFEVGKDFNLAYSPERINPGDKQNNLYSMPKIVSGVTEQCLKRITALYSSVFETIVPVSSPRVAEMAKVMENSQRFINISFVNELAKFCDEMQIDIWEVIDAINTKPYGNLYFYPSSGVGGHCIPVDPLYLDWKAKQIGVPLQFIRASKQINDSMPDYILNRLLSILPGTKRFQDRSILLIGVSFKKDVNDTRESSAIRVMSLLLEKGAQVLYHDPLVPELTLSGNTHHSIELSPDILQSVDCTVILTDHSSLPVDLLVKHSPLIFDTKNATKSYSALSHIIRM